MSSIISEVSTKPGQAHFEEWAHSVGDEVLVTLRTKGPMDLAALGKALKVSPDSVLFFLGRLVRDGRATITGIQATSDG